jgi:acyl-coenzyme A synthetase/AMP-(fatty) acid ligase/acyl carrier protein
VNLCYGLKEFFADQKVKNTALITSISFDISVNQIFPTLVFGRTLHVIANEVKYDPEAFLSYLGEQEIDLFDCVPSYLNSVLRETVGAALRGRPSIEQSVKYVLVGGEKVERSLLEKVFDRWEEAALVNIYGLTEITDINTLSVIRKSDLNDVITIGRPLQNTRVYITDEYNNLQPVGVSGELCVTGDGVSRGYLNRPGLTAEKFVPVPWKDGGEDGAVMCRTGDVARWLEDGRIELLGRRDQQVKIRGYRIEVGEIEVMLESHPEVKEAVVVMREDVPGDKRLVAYLASAADGGLSAELPGFLKEKLPEYMVPSAFVMLDELPHLPNGKINRNSLPAPEAIGSESLAAYVPPQNELEQTLAGIWQDVLQTPQVGVYDNFFSDLGGNSLMLIQVVGKLREALSRDISMIEMFQFPTIHSFAQHLASTKSETSSIDETNDQTQRRREVMQQRRQIKQHRRTMTAEQGVNG